MQGASSRHKQFPKRQQHKQILPSLSPSHSGWVPSLGCDLYIRAYSHSRSGLIRRSVGAEAVAYRPHARLCGTDEMNRGVDAAHISDHVPATRPRSHGARKVDRQRRCKHAATTTSTRLREMHVRPSPQGSRPRSLTCADHAPLGRPGATLRPSRSEFRPAYSESSHNLCFQQRNPQKIIRFEP